MIYGTASFSRVAIEKLVDCKLFCLLIANKPSSAFISKELFGKKYVSYLSLKRLPNKMKLYFTMIF